MSNIHPMAIIDPTAQVHASVAVGPYAVIGPNVIVGADSVIASHAVIYKNTKIGQNNRIDSFALIGGDPQSKLYQPDDDTFLEMGDHNVCYRYCSIDRGTTEHSGKTMIGHHNVFMAHSHVAHDCRLADHIVMINHSILAGHVMVDSHVMIGKGSAIRQFCKIGESTFVNHGIDISKDVMPYIVLRGTPPKLLGLNKIGLQRRGFSTDTIAALGEAYRIIFRRGLTTKRALEALEELAASCEAVKKMYDFMRDSERGLVR